MKKQQMYQVDAFAGKLFGGNPAAVCPLTHWLDDELMQSIAAENNLSETAFIVPTGEHYEIRWFTPNTEVALCGHATLASAFVLFEFLNYKHDEILFRSKSGELRVRKAGDLLQMDFPALTYTKIDPTPSLLEAVKVNPVEVYESTFDMLFILDNEEEVTQANPDLQAIGKLNSRGIILSAPTNRADVYSRCFYPGCDVPEDPVTGSAHCVIAPYWCNRLGKNSIHALQGGKRQGELWCEIRNDRVLLSGTCQLYLEGTIVLP
ncbi:PhzF family phenazine biosynthesis protein [Legionella shakespearei]|uniref:Epimerase n=1 Tax=Legionella shakespearei DSM 23087 TaxID=1122169 RepID=A0A0W0YL54_9GAMM|nr:PhzF family phenazine biosynthesis protein [Legionella shakespearei]KTD57660.1 epimerase [Legionella shakespearei DSM 23087]